MSPWPRDRPVCQPSIMLTSNGYVLDEDARRLGELEAVPERERNDRDALRERLRKTGYLYLRGGTDAVLTSWIPLGDCPLTRAPLIYLEGSHHRMRAEEERAARTGAPRRPAASITADLPKLAAEHDARWLVTDYRAGDMVVHSAYLVHASLDNVDPDGIIRLSTDIRYQRADDTIDLRWQNHWRYDDGL